MLFLCGGNVISVVTSINKQFIITDIVPSVGVTIKAMTLTDVGIRLRRLPISLKAVLNSLLLVFMLCSSSTNKITSFS